MTLMLAALLLVSDPAVATTAVEPAVNAEKSDKKICKIDPNHTGSRMRRKLCLTEVEWEKRNAGKSAGDLKTMGGR